VGRLREQELAARRSGSAGPSSTEEYRPFATYSIPNDDSPMALWRVDEAPVMLNEAILDYPSAVRAQGIEGDVFVECIVNRDGDTDDIRVVRGPEALHESAVSATRRTRFTPARYDGHPVSARILRRVRFRLDGGDDSQRSSTDSDRRSELGRRAGEQRARHADSLSTYEVWTSPDPTESWPFGLRLLPSSLKPRDPFPSAANRPALMWWMADRTPMPLERPKPEYPSEAVVQGLEGDVFIEMHVSKAGDVRNEWVVSGPEVFHESALAAAHRTLFPPARRNGVASAFAAFLTIRYRMDPESEAGPSTAAEVRGIEERQRSARSATSEVEAWLAELRAGGINAPTLPTAPRLTRPRLPDRPDGDPSTWDYDTRETLRAELVRYASAVGAERGKVTRYEGELRQLVYSLRRLLSQDAWEAHQPKLAGLTEGAQRLDAIARGYSLAVEPLNDEYLAALPARPQLDDGSLTRIHELDEEPRLVEAPEPVYPESARRAALECTVWWEAVLGVDGSLRGIRIVDGREEFFASARHVLENSRYTPGMLNGEPVAVHLSGFIPHRLEGNGSGERENNRSSELLRPPVRPSGRPSRWSYDEATRYVSEFIAYHNALESDNATWLAHHADDPATWNPERFSREALAWKIATDRTFGRSYVESSWGEFIGYLRSQPKYAVVVPSESEIQDKTHQIGEYGARHFSDCLIQIRRLAAARWKERVGRHDTDDDVQERIVDLNVRIAELLTANTNEGPSVTYVRVRISPEGRTEYLQIEREVPPLTEESRNTIRDIIVAHTWRIVGYPHEIVVRFTNPVDESIQRLLDTDQHGRTDRERTAPQSMTAEEASREVLMWEAARGRLRGNDSAEARHRDEAIRSWPSPDSWTAEQASRELLAWYFALNRLGRSAGYAPEYLDFLRTGSRYSSLAPSDAEIRAKIDLYPGESSSRFAQYLDGLSRAAAERWIRRSANDPIARESGSSRTDSWRQIREVLAEHAGRRGSVEIECAHGPDGGVERVWILAEDPPLTDALREQVTEFVSSGWGGRPSGAPSLSRRGIRYPALSGIQR